MLEGAELLQGLRPLERGRRQRDVALQELAPVGVQADVLPERRLRRGVAAMGDRRAGEVEREAPAVDDDLHPVRIGEVRRLGAVHQRGHRGLGGLLEGRDDGVDHEALDQGLVALDVHHDVVGEAAARLGEPVGAGRVVRARQQRSRPEAAAGLGDARVVGGDEHVAEPLRPARALVHPLEHGQAGDRRQRLPGEAARRVPGRNDPHRRHGSDASRWVHSAARRSPKPCVP